MADQDASMESDRNSGEKRDYPGMMSFDMLQRDSEGRTDMKK